MPISTTCIIRPTDDQQRELEKIYQDVSTTTLGYLLKDYQRVSYTNAGWVAAMCQQSNLWRGFWAGTFNGHLIAAAWLDKRDSQHWHLHAPCVRAITRRRGVATDLIRQLKDQCVDARLSLWLHESDKDGVLWANSVIGKPQVLEIGRNKGLLHFQI